MNAEGVRRRMARILNTSPDSISTTEHQDIGEVSMDFQYDTYLHTRVQSSVVYHVEDEIFHEMRIRLPEFPNNAESGTQARDIQRFLSDHLERFVNTNIHVGLLPEWWARVEIATSGFVMHIEARNVPKERGFALLKALSESYEQPDPDRIYSEFSS